MEIGELPHVERMHRMEIGEHITTCGTDASHGNRRAQYNNNKLCVTGALCGVGKHITTCAVYLQWSAHIQEVIGHITCHVLVWIVHVLWRSFTQITRIHH